MAWCCGFSLVCIHFISTVNDLLSAPPQVSKRKLRLQTTIADVDDEPLLDPQAVSAGYDVRQRSYDVYARSF